MLSTVLSLFPPTAAAGLTMKALQGFSSLRNSPLEYTNTTASMPMVSSFFPQVLEGAAAGALGGLPGGFIGAGIGAAVGGGIAAVHEAFKPSDEEDDGVDDGYDDYDMEEDDS